MGIFAQILYNCKILVQDLKAVAAVRIGLDHIPVILLLIINPKNIIIVTDLDRPLIIQRNRIHHIEAASVFRYGMGIQCHIDLIRSRIVRHSIAVLPLPALHTLCQRIRRNRITILIGIPSVIGGYNVRNIRIVRHILHCNDIIFCGTDRLYHAAVARLFINLIPLEILQCVISCDFCTSLHAADPQYCGKNQDPSY